MQYIAGFMIVAFQIIGNFLVLGGFKELFLKLLRRAHLKEAPGVVVSVVKERKTASSTPDRHHKTVYSFYPVIEFKPSGGEKVTFRSEVGDSGYESKFAPRQRLSVRYDPDNKLLPMINSWEAMWGVIFYKVFSGAMLVGASIAIYTVFGDKIFGV